MKKQIEMTMAQIVAEINKLAGTSLKPTAFKNKTLALARLESVKPKSKAKTSQAVRSSITASAAATAKAGMKAAAPVAAKPTAKVKLIATPAEVKELQAIRDLRLANKSYEAKKTAFFKKFRAKYGITTQSRIKVETEDPAKLGVTQYVSNNMFVTTT